MPSYVFVWHDNLAKTRRVQEVKWVGHAAMNIGDRFSLGVNESQSNYVSWWPSEGAKFSWIGLLMSYAKLNDQNGDVQPCLPADVISERYLPDHIIELPSDVHQEEQMRESWNSIRARPGSYNSVWQNCSTMVARILDDAGLLPAKSKVWTPTVLNDVISKIKNCRRMTCAGMTDIIENGKGIVVKEHIVITHARSGAYCTIEVPVLYQPDQRWSSEPIKKAK